MNTTSTASRRNDSAVAAIGVLVLLLGTATGSAYAMLIMAVAALALVTAFYGRRWGRPVLLVTSLAAAVATAFAFAIEKL